MIVQHNIMAINSHRQLGINNTSLSKNLEKLSSGYRINKAADDAAGLAISEKMRAQITGLNRAVMNAQDGASLIQTAEGALQEVHGMLNRMVELATQSANGTIQADDRQKIEAETKALKDEIDRISEATNFNGIKLLDGSLSTSGVSEISIDNLPTNFTAATQGVYTLTMATASTGAAAAGDVFSYTIATSDGASTTFDFTVNAAGTHMVTADGAEYAITAAGITTAEMGVAVKGELAKTAFADKFDITTAGATLVFTAKDAGTAAPRVTGVGATFKGATVAGAAIATVAAKDEFKSSAVKTFMADGSVPEESAIFSVNGVKFAVAESAAAAEKLKDKGVNVLITAAVGAAAPADIGKLAALINQKTGLQVSNMAPGTTVATANLYFTENAGSGKGLTMQVGDTADSFNKITVSVENMSSLGLGIAGIAMATQESAAAALDAIKSAIEKVSVNRGNLGALQNRLEHTINNLNVTSENMTASESRIRDVDMAKEMMDFTKNNVLAQAAQAMLAQANQQPQQVLQLLR